MKTKSGLAFMILGISLGIFLMPLAFATSHDTNVEYFPDYGGTTPSTTDGTPSSPNCVDTKCGWIEATPDTCTITEHLSQHCQTTITWGATGVGTNNDDHETGIFAHNPATNIWNDQYFASVYASSQLNPEEGKNKPDWITLTGTNFVFFAGCDGTYGTGDNWWVPDRETCEVELDRVFVQATCDERFVPNAQNTRCVCPAGTKWNETSQSCEAPVIVCDTPCTIGEQQCVEGSNANQTCVAVPGTCDTQWSAPAACDVNEQCAEGLCGGPQNFFDGDNYRAFFATTLITIASNDYVIECGPTDVLNTRTYLPEILGWPDEPAVCTLIDDGEFAGVMFTRNPDEDIDASIAATIEHLGLYNDQGIDNINIITDAHLNQESCANPVDAGMDWVECPDAVSGLPYDVRVYYLLDNPISYFVTYNYEADFDLGIWDTITGFFSDLFGLQPIDPDSITSFSRGYFANTNSKTVNAVYHATSPYDDGSATIIYEDFSIDMSELAPDAEYVLDGNEQTLTFSTMTPTQWKALTASLRIE